jgi:hypothetical protein
MMPLTMYLSPDEETMCLQMAFFLLIGTQHLEKKEKGKREKEKEKGEKREEEKREILYSMYLI